ncbi:MAG TPA: P-loop NTPase fold protein [Verrucomicrobiae bacterium]|nr:P-loop NTPase fold protein [Verrucomicrobiae bacterium]
MFEEGKGQHNNGKSQSSTPSATSGHAKRGPIKIITDEPTLEDALDFANYSQSLADIIINSTPRFSIGIFGAWGTGKTSLMKMVKDKLVNKDDVLTVWFDAWKYEREKNLAIVPLIRTIEIELEDKMLKLKDSCESNNSVSKIRNAWNSLREPLKRIFTSIESMDLTIKPIFGFEGKIPLSKAIDNYNANGYVIVDNERRYYYRHQTERLADALNKIKEKISSPRVVVFIDDLDRCNPEKALEILESIKAFFDIEGFIYVIGMDSKSIDSIVRKKFGDDSGVKGIDYLQKIVQLPFHIPVWKESDISKSIDKFLLKGLEGSELIEDFKKNKELIVKAVERNPRQVKRFINNVILAKAVFNKDIDKLIVVRALDFREDWQKFLDLITPKDQRRKFFEVYQNLKAIEKNGKIEQFTKNLSDEEKSSFMEKFGIFFELIKTDVGKDLINFLDAGAATILGNIDDMEEYRRALESTEDKPIENTNFNYLFSQGLAHTKLGNHFTAIKFYDKCLDLAPNNLRVLNSKAYGLAHIKKYEEAEEIIDRVLDEDPNYAKALDTKGFILLKKGILDEAEKKLQAAAEMEPSYAKYKHLADLYAKKNQPDEERKYREKAEELRKRRYLLQS